MIAKASSARIVERTLELIRNPKIGRDAFLKHKGIRVVDLEQEEIDSIKKDPEKLEPNDYRCLCCGRIYRTKRKDCNFCSMCVQRAKKTNCIFKTWEKVAQVGEVFHGCKILVGPWRTKVDTRVKATCSDCSKPFEMIVSRLYNGTSIHCPVCKETHYHLRQNMLKRERRKNGGA